MSADHQLSRPTSSPSSAPLTCGRQTGPLSALVVTLLLALCMLPAGVSADPASDLASGEAARSQAESSLTAAEAGVTDAEATLTPIAKKAEAAEGALADAELDAQRIEEDLVEERNTAAEEVRTGEADYDDEKSSHDALQTLGLVLIVLALVLAGGALVWTRVGKWPLSRLLTQLGGGLLGLLLIGGVVLVALPGPDTPEFTNEQIELSDAADGDPADPPTAELSEAEEDVMPLADKAQPLEAQRQKAEGNVSAAELEVEDVEGKVSAADHTINVASKELSREEAIAERETRFREEATTIDYDQLIKNPFNYIGEKVVYTGQIFQIQEGFGSSFMLLSVTDEGYGFWTDEIWVGGFGEIESAEEDLITVYGVVTGAEEYETAIGGSNYVPKIKAKYVDE